MYSVKMNGVEGLKTGYSASEVNGVRRTTPVKNRAEHGMYPIQKQGLKN
jgi:hypothetical protein